MQVSHFRINRKNKSNTFRNQTTKYLTNTLSGISGTTVKNIAPAKRSIVGSIEDFEKQSEIKAT